MEVRRFGDGATFVSGDLADSRDLNLPPKVNLGAHWSCDLKTWIEILKG